MTNISRRTMVRLLGASAAAGAIAASGLVPISAHAQTNTGPKAPKRGAYLIKGGTVITVDPTLGTMQRADILVRNGMIEQVGADVSADSDVEIIDATGMIVMPGMIDTHSHMWETIGRNMLSDDKGYFPVKDATANIYTPDDFYNSVAIGLVEFASAGVTTVHNWSHNNPSPEHADAELRAHRDFLLRARYSYGRPNGSPTHLDFDDIDRVNKEWFGPQSPFEGLVHLGVNLARPEAITDSAVLDFDVKQAAARQLPMALHAPYEPPGNMKVADYEQRGFLGPNFLMAHLYYGSQEDFDIIARHGTPMSFAPYTLAGVVGDAHSGLTRMRRAGVTISLSSDATSIGPVDMFDLVRLAWNFGMPVVGGAEGQKSLGYLEAIQMATINGAKALGIDAITGSITPGKRADIILVRTNEIGIAPMALPEATVVMSAKAANVDTVLVDGRVVKRNGSLTAYDVPKVLAAAEASALRIRKEVGDWLTPASP